MNIILVKQATLIGMSMKILIRLEHKQSVIRNTRINNLNNFEVDREY